MLFQAKIHEREDEGSDGRAGLGWAEGALGEEGTGREGLWSSSLAQTPWGVRWAGGAFGLGEPTPGSVCCLEGAVLPAACACPVPEDVSPGSRNSAL